mmetsp:Transcript_2905/g.3832  ORF Transcript_2905/g.3832 Transcript_2905/m.3832 type:complete len:117 (+) Transcript_2905:94-444(+)
MLGGGVAAWQPTGLATPLVAGRLVKRNQSFGLAIGSCAAAGGFTGARMAGGFLNPAIWFGLAVASIGQRDVWTICQQLATFFWFSCWELAGGLAAAEMFRTTHSRCDNTRSPLLPK